MTPNGNPITLINTFSVPAGREDDFMKDWQAHADLMTKKPGFLNTKLHKSMDPTATHTHVNIAEWASPGHFQAAVQSPEFQALGMMEEFKATPSIYTVQVEY